MKYPQSFGAFDKCTTLVQAILQKINYLNKSRKNFMIHLFELWMGLRGRYNFMNMARYGSYTEQSYRNNFSKDFDFLSFNKELIQQSCSEHRVIVFDPTFIPKSGKHTENLGWFWCGTAGKAMRGLEIGVLSVIDVQNNTAMSLEAIQTPSAEELEKQGKNIVEHYAQTIIDRKTSLESLSKYLIVDGYFFKKSFISEILKKTQLHIIGKMRGDANLWYLYRGPKTGKRGRPKLYTTKVNTTDIDKKYFCLCYEDEDIEAYESVVYCKTLRRNIKVVYLQCKKGKDKKQHIILFSTDLGLYGKSVYEYYKSRYQIEFLFRDAKQYSGLTHCQARDTKKFYFHVNASLTTVSLAKSIYYLPFPKEERNSFSMANVKTIYYNKFIAERIFANLELHLNQQKIDTLYQDILSYGIISARAS